MQSLRNDGRLHPMCAVGIHCGQVKVLQDRQRLCAALKCINASSPGLIRSSHRGDQPISPGIDRVGRPKRCIGPNVRIRTVRRREWPRLRGGEAACVTTDHYPGPLRSLGQQAGGLPIGQRGHHQTVHLLDSPARTHEFDCQPVEELRVGGLGTKSAKIFRCSNNPPPKVLLPDRLTITRAVSG
ncbi:MAG: hypothetical protein CM1200mP2_35360 [Planctomycetaceae bacterium]|nr:MAG: hypothetical protein CM1200mP2_35360 [Planctomycetaceae bacterium]